MKQWARDALGELLGSTAERIDVELWLGPHLEKVRDLSPYEADELAPRLLPDLRAALDETFRTYDHRGLTSPPFHWADPLDQRVLVKADGRHAPREIEERVRRDSKAIRDLFSKLDPTDFEHVCAHLLAIYGAVEERTHVTRRTDDGGFDFVGLLEPATLPGPRRLASQRWRIAGQAKLYKNDVDRDTVEAFGSRTDKWRLRTGDGWLERNIPSWYMESNEPILGLFITTSRLVPGAKRVAPEKVVLYLEGDQVAEDLAWSPKRPDWVDPSTDEIDNDRFILFFRNMWSKAPDA